MSYAALTTPCLLLDRPRLERNLARMAEACAARGVPLRPHLKTLKSVEAARLALSYAGGDRATVSTMKEAEIFGRAGIRDLLYAVAITPGKLARATALRREGVALTVAVDSVEMAERLAAHARETGDAVPALIELDMDGHRSGVRPDDAERLIAIARALREGAALSGVMAHAGASYALSTPEALDQAAAEEARMGLQAATILREAGFPAPVVSVGSTPTALHGRPGDGVTELRAGVFMAFDLVQRNVGVCALEDLALSVLASVISVDPAANRVVIDAGWMALSRDRGTAKQAEDFGYGQVCAEDGTLWPDILVNDAQQEHGIVGARPGSSIRLPTLKVGDRVRVLPNHACATAAQHEAYQVLGSDGATEAVWPRFSGW